MAATLGSGCGRNLGWTCWATRVALLNDAVHNLSDVPALGISWLAMRWAERPADSEKTYGYHRAGTLAAFTNAPCWFSWLYGSATKSIERFRSPVDVVESWMIWTSIAALAVNGGITLALVRGRGDLNFRSILVHNFGDALSNIAIIIGAIIIGATGLIGSTHFSASPSASWSSGPASASCANPPHILLEGSPRDCRVEDMARAISQSKASTKFTTSTSGPWAEITTL